MKSEIKHHVKTGVQLIMEERQEQIQKHHRTIDADVKNNGGHELGYAASVLAAFDWGCNDETDMAEIFSGYCPDWSKGAIDKMINKPYKDRLIIAGALIAAEIDRLNAQITTP